MNVRQLATENQCNTKILEEIEDAIRSTPQKICFAGTGQMAELAGLLKKKYNKEMK